MSNSKVVIKTTVKYSMFNAQGGNRAVLAKNVEKVEAKILAENLLMYHPILVDADLNVIDGQHRLEVAKRNNLELSYIIMNNTAGLATTQAINTTGKPWTVKDLLQSYCTLGNNDYLRFREIVKAYKFISVSQLIGLLNSSGQNDFKDGKLDMKRAPELIKVLDRIKLYGDINLGKLAKNTNFQRFMLAANDRFLFDDIRMIKKINDNINQVIAMPNDCYLMGDILGRLYNYKLRSGNLVDFNIRNLK